MATTIHTEEKELLLRLQGGDHAAFEQVYNQYYYNLTGHLIRLLKSTDLAQEVVQDTFMALWEHRDRLDTDKPIKPYLFKIATNHTFNIFKKASHDQKYRAYLSPIIEAGYEQIETEIFKKENEKILQDILEKMPQKQREVFILCKLQGKSYQEVSDQLNISLHTIHTHIKRSHQFLKQNLAQYPAFIVPLMISASLTAGYTL